MATVAATDRGREDGQGLAEFGAFVAGFEIDEESPGNPCAVGRAYCDSPRYRRRARTITPTFAGSVVRGETDSVS